MHEICGGIGAAHGADVKMTYTHGYPPTVNSDHRSVEPFASALPHFSCTLFSAPATSL